MNYPVWQLDGAGGGLLIAIMAIVHVYISHFAIGGGLFLVMTEMKGYREGSQEILDFTRRHTRFFLLLTMVLGSITGVGIWFTISVLNPAAVSTLIHTFVFAWATEWVFFLAEIVAIFVYYYTFGTMARRQHLQVGGLYFIFAWLSLFAINGILSFMLTPGAWLVTTNFWDGFFNPTFWPALCFRTCIALMLAGLYGFISAVTIKDEKLRETLVRYCALWLLAPFYFLLASAWWYLHALPPAMQDLIMNRMPELAPFIKAFLWLSPLLFTGGLLMAIRLPAMVKRPLAWVLLAIGMIYLGSFEFIREGGRRPFVIHGHTYANAITLQDTARTDQAGVLATARWVKNREITTDNQQEAGGEIFSLLCLPCHALGGPMHDIGKLTAKYTLAGLRARIAGLGGQGDFMPPFPGTTVEAHALALFIMTDRHNDRLPEKGALLMPPAATIPPFDMETSDYVLLAWTDQGIHAISDCDAQWSFAPPGSNLYALLIRRGATPELVNDGVTITYNMEPGDQVLAGATTNGNMQPSAAGPGFAAMGLPVVPYTSAGRFAPYPLVTITARAANGQFLAVARTVLPVTTEIGCRNCHGGNWRVDGVAGISQKTALGVLEAHDRLSRTKLVAQAAAGRPVLCQSCHAADGKGPTAPLNLSAAMHGFHAQLLGNLGAEACQTCHPAGPDGATRFFRGIHENIGLNCTNCHGLLVDHSLSLLQAEKMAGKQRAALLMARLKPQGVTTMPEIKPRQPWRQQPDCLNCHEDFQPPASDSTFNHYTEDESGLFGRRTDAIGIPCTACHGAPHALYPANNKFGQDRDNLIPLQYQATPYPLGANRQCRVCHRQEMREEMHHPNSLREFRNLRENASTKKDRHG